MVHKRHEHGLTSPLACCSSELTHRNPSICTHTASIFLCNSNSNSDSDNNIPTRCQTVPPGRTSRDLSALQSLARLRPHRNTCKAPTRTAACQHPLHTHTKPGNQAIYQKIRTTNGSSWLLLIWSSQRPTPTNSAQGFTRRRQHLTSACQGIMPHPFCLSVGRHQC